MARKIAPHKIKIPLYRTTVFVFFSAEHYESHSREKDEGNSYGVCIDRSYGADIVFYEKRPDTIAHEAVHAAWACLDVTGIDVDRENHESLAYVVGYIVAEIYKGYERYEQKTKAVEEQTGTGASTVGAAGTPA